jgi:hypothetical protein
MAEICIKVERGMDERSDYAAFLTGNARNLAAAIIAMADALDADRDTPPVRGLN